MGCIQGDVDVGLPDASVCSCMESVNCTVKLSAVVALKDSRSWFGVHWVCMEGAVCLSLAFPVSGEGKGKGAGQERRIFYYGLFFWNELGQGGDQERREASLGVRRCRWSRAEVGKFDLC